MKKVILLFGLLMVIHSMSATIYEVQSKKDRVNEYQEEEPVTFVENGVKFHVYPNGDFDFNTRRHRRNGNRHVRVYRDYKGRINRVGNVYIRYDSRGNVRKIGSVYMGYNRGRLSRVGGLKIYYNKWGDPRYYGQIRYTYYGNYNYDSSYNYWNTATIYDYYNPYFYMPNFNVYYSPVKEDANYYYYKARKGTKATKGKYIKRKKLSNGVRTNGKRVYTQRRSQ